MNNGIYLLLFSGMIVSISHLLMKIEAITRRNASLTRFLSLRMLVAYAMMFIGLAMSFIAYRYVSLKLGPIIETLNYIHVLILSWLFLGERFNWKTFTGVTLIMIGVLITF